jgi:predicted extracellular nuclease/endonuclease I
MKTKHAVSLALFSTLSAHASDIVISGVIDGPLPGGTPKAVELYVVNDISNLSRCGIGSANNGGGSDGQEFDFPAENMVAGNYIYVATDTVQFNSFFGFAPNYVSSAANINGNDAIELFCDGAVVDIFGEISVDGSGQPWEHTDGWAYREANTGPDGSTFVLSNWSFSGPNALDDQLSNATAETPFPSSSFFTESTDDGEAGGETGGGDSGSGGDGDGETSDTDVVSSSVCVGCDDVPIEFDASTFDAASYYAAVQTLIDTNASVADIRGTLSDRLEDGHKFLTYPQIWTALTFTDEDPNNTDNVILWYDGRSQAKNSNGSGVQSQNPDNWNREHSWPNSHGFPNEGQFGFTDLHHLRPTDISINGARGNLDFDNSDSPLGESPVNRIDSNSFEPRDDIKGDVARMMFYMDARYEGTEQPISSSPQVGQPIQLTPDVELVGRLTSAGEPRLGLLCTLIAWHEGDPVNDVERLRHDRAYSLQGNRNPFIDNPAWVETLYGLASNCTNDEDSGGGETGGGETGGGETGGEETGGDGVTNSSLVFINEIHYDNSGSDVGEAVEIAALAGTDLAGMSLVLYNGNGGNSYNTTALSGVIPDQQGGFGTLHFPISGIQNGDPDGLALVDAEGNVLQFLSYEGEFIANNGPAQGMMSIDIGVSETSSAGVGTSLQLTGIGFNASSFTWAPSSVDNFGSINTGQTFVAPEPFINELHYDNSGSDTGEAVEIAGLAGTDLTGLSIVLYNGNGGSSYNTQVLTGVIPDQQNGFGTVSFAFSSIQNGDPDGVALIGADGSVIQFLSYEGAFSATNGPANGVMSQDIGVSEASSAAIGTSLQLTGAGFVADDFVWVGSSADSFGRVNTGQSFGAGDVDNGGDNGGGSIEIGQCSDPVILATPIHTIQGEGFESPLLGETLIVEAVVSASFENLGFYFLQHESAEEDGNPVTSEGLFINFTGTDTLPVAGQRVRIAGEVIENFGRTQLDVSDNFVDCGTGTIQATAFTLPFTSFEQRESLENMFVTTQQELVVSDNFNLGVFGDIDLSSQRLFTPTHLFAPNSPEAIALTDANALDRIALDDNIDSRNPASVIYPTGGLSANNTLRVGATVTSLTGPMDFSFGRPRIYPLSEPTFFDSNPRTNRPDLALGNVTIAAANVLNLFNGDGIGGGFPTSRGADSFEEFERQFVKTVEALAAIDADIVGLVEIENDGYGPNSTIAQLTDALNAELGEGEYAFVDGGGVLDTDLVTVGLLYKPGTVSLVGDVQINLDNVFNRAPFAQTFALNTNGETITVIPNHFRAKSCSGSSTGLNADQNDGQGCNNQFRLDQAAALTAWIENNPVLSAQEDIVIVGDLNAYAKEDPIVAIEQSGYVNLIDRFEGDDAYSFIFRGQAGYLDHVLASASLADKAVDATEWHNNVDEPRVLDYNVESKTDEQLISFFAPDPYRASDHDPVVVSFSLEADIASVRGDYDGDGDVDRDDIFGLLTAVQLREEIDLSFDLNDDGFVNSLDVRVMSTLCTRVGCAV